MPLTAVTECVGLVHVQMSCLALTVISEIRLHALGQYTVAGISGQRPVHHTLLLALLSLSLCVCVCVCVCV